MNVSDVVPLAVWFAGGGGAWLLLRTALHRLIRAGLAAPRVVEAQDPAQAGLSFRTVRIATVNQRSLHGWWIPSASGQDSGPAVVVLHGWGGNAEMMLPLARPLHEAGLGALFIDARCHGLSDDDSFASLPRFAEDVDHACEWLIGQAGVAAGKIGLIGHSVGAGAVLLAAARRPTVAAVVSVSAFVHPAEMMQRWLAARKVPGWARRYVLAYVQNVIGHRFDDIAPLTSMGRLQCPVLLVHGEDDEVVPVEDARRLYRAGRQGKARLLVLPGDHETFVDLPREVAAIAGFLRQMLVGVDPVTAGARCTELLS